MKAILNFLGRTFPLESSKMKVMPVSTVEWTSEIRRIDGIPIIIYDVEQANALGYSLIRTLCQDRPIFQYSEYLVRASEALFCLGDKEAALRVAQVNDSRLTSYGKFHGVGDGRLPRPIDVGAVELVFQLLNSHVHAAFLLGHEVGHVIIKERPDSPAFQFIHDVWNANCTSSSQQGEGGAAIHFQKFIDPTVSINFNDEGLPSGGAVRSMHYAKNLKAMIQSFVDESLCDYVGILASTDVAIKYKIEAEHLLQSLLVMQDCMERHLLLRRIVERLPREPCRSTISFEPTKAHARCFLIFHIVLALGNGDLSCSSEIKRYWSGLFSRNPELLDNVGRHAYRAKISQILARGGVHLGAGEDFPENLPTHAELVKKYGEILSGNAAAMLQPFRMAQDNYEIDANANWNHENNVDPGFAGFACAVRDITEVLMHPRKVDEKYGTQFTGGGKNSDAEILEILRRPRLRI